MSEARHIICTIRSLPQHRQRVMALLLELVEPARGEPGCLYYDLQQQADLPDMFHLVDGWVNQAAVDDHATHPNVLRIVAELEPLLASPLEISTSVRISERR
jgi:quinol monooxygenase YgiN